MNGFIFSNTKPKLLNMKSLHIFAKLKPSFSSSCAEAALSPSSLITNPLQSQRSRPHSLRSAQPTHQPGIVKK
jgi:hypothetical protein